MGLPGDITNATRFWGQQQNTADCLNNSGAAVNSSGGTCDGNGNNIIAVGSKTNGQSAENFQFWRQLALAGLMEGTYTGYIPASGSVHTCRIGQECPGSRMSTTGWFAQGFTSFYAGDSYAYSYDYGNVLAFGARTTSAPWEQTLKPEEAWNVDTKLDDGLPAQGKVIARFWGSCTTSTSSTDTTGLYALNTNDKTCALYFPRAF